MDRPHGAFPASLITALVEPSELSGDELSLAGGTYHHLFRSRRVAVGDPLRLVDGAGHARWGRVTSVDRRQARIALGEAAPANEPPRRVELLVAVPRGSRASWLVEKATELGVAAVRWVAAERAPRDITPSALERFDRVARAAVEQCHRARLPEVTGLHPWAALPVLLEGMEGRYLLDPAGEPEAALGAPAGGTVAILVGPEGGWSEDERGELDGLDCRRLSLGPRVLRIETAAIVAAAWALRALPA